MNEHIANQCETERYMRFSSSYACLIIVSLTVIPKHLSEKCSKKYSNFCIEQNFKKSSEPMVLGGVGLLEQSSQLLSVLLPFLLCGSSQSVFK
ncbi:hypothetical protein, partial [Faecalibaculum rodentium]|uniref:hypothetical protein n=2 Tax=Faecalibaculum rodentium TaxID=1702221 RepID=UPI00259C8939